MTRLAIIGATGLVGIKMLETIDRKHIQFDEPVLLSSTRSAGKETEFQGKTYTVQELTKEAASEKFDYVLMSVGSEVSKGFASIFEKAGAIVTDNLSQWHMANDVDLIVPEVNQSEFKCGITANPNRLTI